MFSPPPHPPNCDWLPRIKNCQCQQCNHLPKSETKTKQKKRRTNSAQSALVSAAEKRQNKKKKKLIQSDWRRLSARELAALMALKANRFLASCRGNGRRLARRPCYIEEGDARPAPARHLRSPHPAVTPLRSMDSPPLAHFLSLYFLFLSVLLLLNWNAIFEWSGGEAMAIQHSTVLREEKKQTDMRTTIPSAMLRLAVSLWTAGRVHQVTGRLSAHRVLSGLPTTCMIM